ncbi:NSF attachment protein [Cynara cardunculus var. scolymus]|uniref:Gamma-soluble NSF attachment protein n=1 Tax=Cynara cardunculus var. scolymus TaxID=59895 RepID=A0A103XC04_CYNCS|nr:NSF attachment protein [Cynara cardunculus var. scolymus]
MAGADPEKLIAKADKLTKLTLTRWTADWRNATQYYEQAANAYRFAKKYEKAKVAFEKASKGQEMLSSYPFMLKLSLPFKLKPWDAAKHMESAAALAVELSIWNEVADFYRRASELYNECGRSQPASDALAKGARALEDAQPDEAVAMYTDACSLLEEDGKENMVSDLYRAITSVYVKLEKYMDAATFLLRWAVASNKCNALHSQCKAYLSAIIVYLYAHDFKQAEQCYNDCCQIDTFLSSDQSHCASKLLSAYREADAEEIKRVAKSGTISNLDHVIIRLARKLPTGELIAMEANSLEHGEALDEDDLT